MGELWRDGAPIRGHWIPENWRFKIGVQTYRMALTLPLGHLRNGYELAKHMWSRWVFRCGGAYSRTFGRVRDQFEVT